MATCKFFFFNIILSLFLIFIFTNFSYGDQTFKKLENKKVPYLDFFLLKFENTINKRVQILKGQLFASRVQYSDIGIQVNGKLRGTIQVSNDMGKNDVLNNAKNHTNVKHYLDKATLIKEIYIPGKIINFVVN